MSSEGDNPLEETSDEAASALVERMGRGDRDALEQLFRSFSPRLLALGLRILGNPADAEEVLHEVFLEAFRRARAYDASRGSVRAWFAVRMRSRCLDRVKSNRRSPVVSRDDEHAFLGDPNEMDPARSVDHGKMARALRLLSPEQREVLFLGYFEGLSSSEMAEALELPLGTVKSRVRQALTRLREILSDERDGAS